MIQNINISKISAHYDNPRKELGDLTELADSIKSNGILQNLTVVPWFSQITGVGADNPKQQEEMGYIVVIGHRRLAAAKLAGLTEVPCAISDMDYKKQISTMLLENMQRSDLTVYEQAQGFQMMLNLGESINDISHNTGFSESTVRRRVKLLDLDKDKFKESVERGGTLMDYAELDQINDLKLRNQILEKIGTANFKYDLQRAIDSENKQKYRDLMITELEKFSTQTKNVNGLNYVKHYWIEENTVIDIPNDADTVEYFFNINSSDISLYKKADDIPASDNRSIYEEREKERKERRAELDEISERAYKVRSDFIKNLSNAFAKKNLNIIIEYYMRLMMDSDGDYLEIREFAEFMNIELKETDDEDELTFDDIKDQVMAQPERCFLIALYSSLDSGHNKYYNWYNEHCENSTLDILYDFLEKLGYEISEEEDSIRKGTHKLFVTEDNEEQ